MATCYVFQGFLCDFIVRFIDSMAYLIVDNILIAKLEEKGLACQICHLNNRNALPACSLII